MVLPQRWLNRAAVIALFGAWLGRRDERDPRGHAALVERVRKTRAPQRTPLPTRLHSTKGAGGMVAGFRHAAPHHHHYQNPRGRLSRWRSRFLPHTHAKGAAVHYFNCSYVRGSLAASLLWGEHRARSGDAVADGTVAAATAVWLPVVSAASASAPACAGSVRRATARGVVASARGARQRPQRRSYATSVPVCSSGQVTLPQQAAGAPRGAWGKIRWVQVKTRVPRTPHTASPRAPSLPPAPAVSARPMALSAALCRAAQQQLARGRCFRHLLAATGVAVDHHAVLAAVVHAPADGTGRPLCAWIPPREALLSVVQRCVNRGLWDSCYVWRCGHCRKLNRGRSTCRGCHRVKPARASRGRAEIPYLKFMNLPVGFAPDALLQWIDAAVYAAPRDMKLQLRDRERMTDIRRSSEVDADWQRAHDLLGRRTPRAESTAHPQRRSESAIVQFQTVDDADLALMCLAGGCAVRYEGGQFTKLHGKASGPGQRGHVIEVEVFDKRTHLLAKLFEKHVADRRREVFGWHSDPELRGDLLDVKASVARVAAVEREKTEAAAARARPDHRPPSRFLVVSGFPASCPGDNHRAEYLRRLVGPRHADAIVWVDSYAAMFRPLTPGASGKERRARAHRLADNARSGVVETTSPEAAAALREIIAARHVGGVAVALPHSDYVLSGTRSRYTVRSSPPPAGAAAARAAHLDQRGHARGVTSGAFFTPTQIKRFEERKETRKARAERVMTTQPRASRLPTAPAAARTRDATPPSQILRLSHFPNNAPPPVAAAPLALLLHVARLGGGVHPRRVEVVSESPCEVHAYYTSPEDAADAMAAINTPRPPTPRGREQGG